MKNNRDDRVMELDIQQIKCQLHTKQRGYYSDEEMREMYWVGKLTDIPPLDNAEFIASDYGYVYIDCCDKWVEEEQWDEEQ